MRIILSITLLIVFGLSACKEEKRNDFFPVLSFIQSQVKHVDTSVYSIMKITPLTDSTADTVYIKREEFRKEAADFLSIPDLTEGRYTKKYEQREDYDPDTKRAIFSYYPTGKKVEILRQEVTVLPTEAGFDKIRNIYIERTKEIKGGMVLQKLFWTADESFKQVDIIQKKGQPEQILQKELVWNRATE